MLFVVETATLSNGFDAASGLHQEASGRVHPDGLNGLGRSTASLGKVDASKVPGAHVDTPSETFDAQVLCEVLCDPQFKRFEYVVGGPDLSRQERAVLRLTARAFQVDDEDARNGHCQIVSEVFFDQG